MNKLWIDIFRRKSSEIGISQSECARRIGEHKSTFNTWMTGRVDPNFDQLQKIADVLGIPIWHFFVEDPNDIVGLRRETEAAKGIAPEKREAYDALMQSLARALPSLSRDDLVFVQSAIDHLSAGRKK